MDTSFPGTTQLVFYGKCRQCICGQGHLSTAVLDINTEFGGEALPPSATLDSTYSSPAKARNVLGVKSVSDLYIWSTKCNLNHNTNIHEISTDSKEL